MTARLIDDSGATRREWKTGDSAAAMTADRNCPIGWRVEVA